MIVIVTIGIDLAKNVFAVHEMDATGQSRQAGFVSRLHGHTALLSPNEVWLNSPCVRQTTPALIHPALHYTPPDNGV